MTKPFNTDGPKYTTQGQAKVGAPDKRKEAREVNTNHFTNRADNRSKTQTVE